MQLETACQKGMSLQAGVMFRFLDSLMNAWYGLYALKNAYQFLSTLVQAQYDAVCRVDQDDWYVY